MWLTFTLLGPPIGAVTSVTFEQWVLPVPGPLGFYEPQSVAESIDHFLGNLALGLTFCYIAVPVALACGLLASILRLGLPPARDLWAAGLAGLAVGLSLTWPPWEGYPWKGFPRSYHDRDVVDWAVTCVVPALCCGWLTRRCPDRVVT